jgi:hypothetical protein
VTVTKGIAVMINIASINPDAFYSTQEAMNFFGKSYAWFARHRWKKTGPNCNQNTCPVLYKGADLIAWLDKGRGAVKSAA